MSDLWPPNLFTWWFWAATVYFKQFKRYVSWLAHCSSWCFLSSFSLSTLTHTITICKTKGSTLHLHSRATQFTASTSCYQIDKVLFCGYNGKVFKKKVDAVWNNTGITWNPCWDGLFPLSVSVSRNRTLSHCWNPTSSLCHSKHMR